MHNISIYSYLYLVNWSKSTVIIGNQKSVREFEFNHEHLGILFADLEFRDGICPSPIMFDCTYARKHYRPIFMPCTFYTLLGVVHQPILYKSSSFSFFLARLAPSFVASGQYPFWLHIAKGRQQGEITPSTAG